MELEEKIKNYKPSDDTVQLIRSTPILVLVGPTGAGKDSLKEMLLATGKYHHIVSHTTRPPRINHGILEQDGKDYHFIDKPTAEKMLDEHAFIEAKMYSGNIYGTSVSEVQKAHDEGLIATTDIDVQGVSEYKALDPNVMAVFLLPPNFNTWQTRLRKRYGDVVDLEDYKVRLRTGLTELDQLLNSNYYIAVINDDLDEAFDHIHTIVSSDNHTTPDEPKAREVAKQLAVDIQKYLHELENENELPGNIG